MTIHSQVYLVTEPPALTSAGQLKSLSGDSRFISHWIKVESCSVFQEPEAFVISLSSGRPWRSGLPSSAGKHLTNLEGETPPECQHTQTAVMQQSHFIC